MKRKFLTNLIFLISLNLIIKPFWVLGIDRGVQNAVSSGSYGIYFSLFNLSILFNIILDFGITNFNSRSIAQNKYLLPKYFSNIIVFKLILSTLYALITLAVGIVAKYSFSEFKILFLLIFNQFLLSFILYLRSNISGLQHFKIDSIASVLDRFLMIIIIGTLLWTNIAGGQMKIEWFVIAQTFSYLTTTIIVFFIVLHYAKFVKLKFNKAFFVFILKKSFPFAVLVFLMGIYTRIDAVFINRLLPDGDVQTGIYAQSFRLLDATSQFALLFANLLLPMFAKAIKQKKDVSELVVFALFLVIVPVIIFVVPSIFYKSEIIALLYSEHVAESVMIFPILITVLIPVSITYIFGTLLTANGSLKQLNIIAFSGVIVNIVLNLLLIPVLKIKGAAITALTTQLLTATAQALVAIRLFKIRIEIKKGVAILLFAGLFAGLVIVVHWLNFFWVISYFVSMFIGGGLAFALRLINVRAVWLLLKKSDDE